MRLPSTQNNAKAMSEEPWEDEENLIGKGVDQPTADEKPVSITTISKAFSKNCPLWVYVLAEAMKKQEAVRIPVKENVSITTPKLGQVGGRIVAEVFQNKIGRAHV